MGLIFRVAIRLVALLVAAHSFAQQPLSLPYHPSRLTGAVGYYLEDMHQKTGVSFSYSSQYVDVSRAVRVSDTISLVGSMLGELFSATDIVFRIQGNKILLLSSGDVEGG